MSAGISIVGGTGGTQRPLAVLPSLPDSPAPDQGSFAERLGAAGEAGPPPEVQAEVKAAARAADRLHELGRELRFERDPESGDITIEVRDLDGNVLRRVPPSEVFDFASGRTVD
ncbi:MAG TPA: flagellar protein FlaG [Solirubrobacterales bacterium]|nr:flagellar protein FlaG [Solirubrobacterales bacterium]